jgi:hypothetical protein
MVMTLTLFAIGSESCNTDKDEGLSPQTTFHSSDELEGVWHQTDFKMNDEMFLRTIGLNIVFVNTEVVSVVIGDELVQVLADQSNFYHSQNAHWRKISPGTFK